MSPESSESVRLQMEELSELARRTGEELAGATAEVARRVLATFAGGGKVLFCGNGGSAADAQHLAAEYVVRFSRERRPLPALALTTDTSILTAGGNDYGFEAIFRRQVEALAAPGDLLVLHSTSGESENLVQAAHAARERGVATVAFLARGGGRLADLVDLALVVPTDVTARAQEIHLALEHVVCDLVDEAVASEDEPGPGRGASRELLALLAEGRSREMAQARFYRRLSTRADRAGDAVASERLNELLADEQHHVSRLTARMLELGGHPRDDDAPAPEEVELEGWEVEARRRERAEVAWYEAALDDVRDPTTRGILEEILASERHHMSELGGKWMAASPPARRDTNPGDGEGD